MLVTFKLDHSVYGRHWTILLDGEPVGMIVPVGPGSLYFAPRDLRVMRASDGKEVAHAVSVELAKAVAEGLCRSGELKPAPKERVISRVESILDKPVRSSFRGKARKNK